MHSLEKINEYVASVCQQIRWKKAHSRISEEITDHITDCRDAYKEQGFDEQTATEKAVFDTGDALLVGTQLDRIHRPKPQWGMFIWIAVFLLLGIYFSFFLLGSGDAYIYRGAHSRLIWTAVGAVIMLVSYFADFSILGKYPARIFIGAALLIILLFQFNALGIPANATNLRSLTLVFPVMLVPAIFAAKNKGYPGLIMCLLAYVFLCWATLATPGFTAFAHFIPVGISLLVFAVLRGWFGVKRLQGYLMVVVPHIIVLAIFLWTNIRISGSHFTGRIITILNPHTDSLGFGFLATQARLLLNNAVMLGEGNPGQFYETFWPMRYMNQMLHADFLLTAVIFRFGWLAFMVLLCALLFFIAKAVARSFKQKSSLGFFVSIAIIMTFSMQVLNYVIFNLGFPIMIISLPLISPGNTAIVVNMGLMGFMLSVFRTGDAFVDRGISLPTKNGDFLSWNDGRLTINFKART